MSTDSTDAYDAHDNHINAVKDELSALLSAAERLFGGIGSSEPILRMSKPAQDQLRVVRSLASRLAQEIEMACRYLNIFDG